MTWGMGNLKALAWRPPACTGWPPSSPSRLVVALAGTFHSRGGPEILLERIGSVSTLKEVRYWSVTDQAWEHLALDASALSSADPESRRSDFSASELVKGGTFYYLVNDRRVGPAVYRMQILELEPSRVIVASENVSPVRYMFVTLFQPGALQTVEYLDKESEGSWRVYLMTRIDSQASLLVGNQEASSVNRLVALYRRLADIPTDQEPPAFP